MVELSVVLTGPDLNRDLEDAWEAKTQQFFVQLGSWHY